MIAPSGPLGCSRRRLLAGLAAAPALTCSVAPTLAQTPAAAQTRAALKAANGTKLVTLGTAGGPVPGLPRKMTSHVMLSNGAAYVLDCGLGVTDRFAETGIPFSAVRSIFITHHHPDHNCEYGPYLLVGWVNGLRPSVRSYGPPPLKQMTEDLLRAYKPTIAFWAEDFKMVPLGAIDVTEVSGNGLVMHDDNVAVTSTVVQHPPVTPALGYRFDFRDRAIAFSGDTTPLDAVAHFAEGADVLVHEAIYFKGLEELLRARASQGFPVNIDILMAHMRADHSPVEDIGRIAEGAGVKTLVISHLVPAIENDDTWQAAAAKTFKGEIIVAKDLMVL
jgi:ribonuclease BN (tRNA processing enzyme)